MIALIEQTVAPLAKGKGYVKCSATVETSYRDSGPANSADIEILLQFGSSSLFNDPDISLILTLAQARAFANQIMLAVGKCK